jgi:predicted O-methyltransferase YrrM
MSHNPYPYRKLPVGQLDYPLPGPQARQVQLIKRHCLLEYGEPEVLFDMPRIIGQGGEYLNLGHGGGGSTILLASGLVEQKLPGTVHSVDYFDKADGYSLKRAMEVVSEFNVQDRVKLYRGNTKEFANSFTGMQFTFLFIDAGHSYEEVLHDFLVFSPLVKVDGVVAFHDTNQDPSDKVITENVLNGPWQQILHVNRIKAFKRV